MNRRIIPCLLLSGRKLVKTQKFADAKYVGDPINAVKIFNDKEVDEIMIVDIEASTAGKEPQFEFLQEIVTEAFIPVTYAGGVNSLQHVDKLFRIGVEKVCMNSVNADSLDLIRQASQKYGSQSILGVIDFKKNFWNKPGVFFKKKNLKVDSDIVEYATALQEAGVGEILLQSVDRDGTYQGYDLDVIQKINKNLKVPLIVLGGAGKLEDFTNAFKAGADAVAAGSLFVFHGPHRAVLIQYPDRETIRRVIRT